MGLLAVLQVIFIVLKMTELIAWSWWAVFFPAYIIVVLFIGGLMGMMYVAGKMYKEFRR
jgi:hypothetical protein